MEHRTLRLPDLFQHGTDSFLRNRRRKRRVVLGGVIALQCVRFNIPALEIHRDIDPHRAGPSGHRQVPCAFQVIPDRPRILDHDRILGHGRRGFYNVIFLVSHCAHSGAGLLHGKAGGRVITDLPGHNEHRNGIQPAAQNAGQRVCSAGTRRHADCGDPVVQPGIGFRRHGAGLLMMVICHAELLMVAEGVVQVHRPAADDGKHIRHPVTGQEVRHIIRQTLFHLLFLSGFLLSPARRLLQGSFLPYNQSSHPSCRDKRRPRRRCSSQSP